MLEQLLRRLPARPHSAWVRLAITSGLVGLSFIVLLGLQRTEGLLGFYVLLPSIFICSVLLNRGSGLYASALSTVLLYVLLTPQGSVLLPTEFILPLVLFALVATGLAIVSEGLRKAWERAVAAERAKDLLLQELGHRTKNNLMMVISMLSMQAQLKRNPETARALEKAVARVHAIASAHEHFRPIRHKGVVEMRAYLEQLCAHLGDALRDVRPIAVKVDADELYLSAEQAVALGLIVNELVTNSLKYAFSGDRGGAVDVVLRRGANVLLLVKDNGGGCPAIRKEGLGTRLVRLLAQQLNATIAWEEGQPGCQVRATFPAPEQPVAHGGADAADESGQPSQEGVLKRSRAERTPERSRSG